MWPGCGTGVQYQKNHKSAVWVEVGFDTNHGQKMGRHLRFIDMQGGVYEQSESSGSKSILPASGLDSCSDGPQRLRSGRPPSSSLPKRQRDWPQWC